MKHKEEKSKKSKMLGIAIGIVAFALSYYGVQQLMKPNIEAELKNAAVELNKRTPMQIDQYTRLDSAASNGKKTFIYYYTLVEIEKSEVNLDTVNKYIRPDDNKITLDYMYYDKNGNFVMEIEVNPDMYKD